MCLTPRIVFPSLAQATKLELTFNVGITVGTVTARLDPRYSRGPAPRPRNPGFQTVVFQGSPGYALYPSAQVPAWRPTRGGRRE